MHNPYIHINPCFLWCAVNIYQGQEDVTTFKSIRPSNPPNPLPCPSAGELTRNLLKRTIQRGIQGRVNDFWKEKIGRYVMQGDYLALIIEEGNCISWKSYMWDIPQGVLKFALNAGVQGVSR